MSVKEQQRNLKREVGRQAADAIAAAQAEVQRLALAHRVLAAQMLEFERLVATVRVGRARDMDELRVLIGQERTHWLELADQQRDYVDRVVNERKLEARAENDLLENWIRRFESMTFLQRLRWLLAGQLTWTPPAAAATLVDVSPATPYPGDGL